MVLSREYRICMPLTVDEVSVRIYWIFHLRMEALVIESNENHVNSLVAIVSYEINRNTQILCAF